MAKTQQAENTLDASAPFEELLSITPSDETTYSPPLRGVIVQADGDVIIETLKGDAAVTIAALKGQLIPALITKVKAGSASVVGGR